ncbi:hypothetical protein ACWN6Y_03235 [Vagococcus teuberi]|uniref:Uncharacterized protein n=1 Tax=Vagococcus teuberi TaxID=519472 RepID=A0A1J0A4L8_9ENTE|nr:hypothetical protein [Vagococcus teuberi]APB30883.1 hypothetical protein BHY08_02975 [Vagococcus teuberi]
MITFHEIASQITNNSPNYFLEIVNTNHLQELTDYFIFSTEKKQQNFYQTLDFLADDGIWTQEELQEYTFIAQTIDSDYVLATDSQTLVIPYSCFKSESEHFDLTIASFFSSVEQGTLNSNVIAKID